MRPNTRTRIATLTLATFVLTASAPAFASDNPLDRVGVEHNVYLSCLMRDGSDQTKLSLQRVVEECGFDPGTSTDEFVARYSSLVQTDPYKTVADRMSPYREAYDDYQFSFFERIDEVIATAETQADADAKFAALESEAVERLTKGDSADQSILAALSTARHSLEYWSKVAGTEPPAATVGKDESKLRWFWKVLVVVGADLLGAAGGTLIGGPGVGGAVGAASSTGAATVLK